MTSPKDLDSIDALKLANERMGKHYGVPVFKAEGNASGKTLMRCTNQIGKSELNRLAMMRFFYDEGSALSTKDYADMYKRILNTNGTMVLCSTPPQKQGVPTATAVGSIFMAIFAYLRHRATGIISTLRHRVK